MKTAASISPASPPRKAVHAIFAQLVVSGMSKNDAYRKAYDKPKATTRRAGERVKELLAIREVADYIEALRNRREVKTILSLNDRLKILANDAQRPGDSPAMVNARARAIEVYNKTAGDHAPERQEVTVKGDAGQPVVVAQVPITKAQKIAALAASRRPLEAVPVPTPVPA